MKKIFLSCLMALFLVSSFAQKNDSEDRTAEAITKLLVEKYDLTASQETKVLKIQQRKIKNQNEFAQLETTDIEKYVQKVSSNQRQTLHAMRMIFSKEQIVLLDEERMRVRKEKAAISYKMQKEGASAIDIRKALLDIK